jgi:membrane fusion protein, macrolide-specific efflux system
MIRFDRIGCLYLIALPLALAACGKAQTSAAPAQKAPTSNFVAIARGKVDVDGGLVRVAAARDGVVTELHADVGASVKAGDVLVVLDPRQTKIATDLAHAELDAANAQTALLRAKLPGLKQRAARVLEASQAGAISGQSADDARQALAELNAEIKVAETGIEAAAQKLRQAEFEIDVRTLRAPVSGHIVARNTHIGDIVSAQGASDLVEILPDGPRIVRAELNEGFVAKVGVGMSAEVYSEVDSARIYPARVTRIGEVFGPSKLIETGQDPTDTRDVECILELGTTDLKVGQRVQIRFLPKAT